ncbi:MAG: helix-turn-helix domain-containing protein [Chitinophagaceae bacterium]
MQVDFRRPTNPLLSDLIEGYYFLQEQEPGKQFGYYTFPNNFFILSVLENAGVTVNNNQVDCRPTSFPCFRSNLTCSYMEPLFIRYHGTVNELSIYFKPLGIYAFLPFQLLRHSMPAFSDFIPFDDYEQQMTTILRQSDRNEQVRLLEEYWLSKKTLEVDPESSRLLKEIESGRGISEIAEQLGISRQYLNRIFLSRLGKTPTAYRKIQRFRNAVNSNTKVRNLTELGYDSMYYDQSHFIRSVKELTSLSPKGFFDKIEAKEGNVWLYV